MANKKGVIVTEDGREYQTVAARVAEFREKHPIDSGWGIRTTVLECTAEQVLCTASIVDPENRVVASGSAQEVWDKGQFNATSALEIAETSAVGRALAFAGFIGVELQISSADEIEQAKKAQKVGKTNKPRTKKEEPVAVDSIPVLQALLDNLKGVNDIAVLEQECNAIADRLRKLRSATPADQQASLKPLVDVLVEYKRQIDAERAS